MLIVFIAVGGQPHKELGFPDEQKLRFRE